MDEPEERVVFRQFVRKETGCCTYLLGSTNLGEYLLVDPLMDYERFLPAPNATAGPRITHVIDTHIHADHLSGAREICRLLGASLMMHRSAPIHGTFVPLDDGATVDLCGLRLEVLHTPGHAPEHVSLLVDSRFLISGDCLLIRDVGRTDLGRGNNADLYRSIFERLLLLVDRVEVYPGHVGSQHFLSGELSSTIGIEKRLNPALQIKDLNGFAKYMTEGWPPKPANYELYVKVNEGLMPLDEAQSRLPGEAQGEA